MKTLFVCAFALLSTIALFAQEQKEVQNLPVLPEWYSWKGDVNTGANISYLPGFDSLGGGMNAITQGRTDDRVWYNRFPFDTTEQFRWKNQGSYAVVQLDFNNDGIHDYIDAKGRIYAGIKKGAKPNPEPVRTFSRGNINNPFVGDMNGDGFQDILMWNSMVDCEIDFGAKEWLSMKRTIVSFPLTGKFSSYIGGYINEVNKPCIIVYVLRDYFEGFYLYGIRTENKGDSVQVYLDELDKIEISKLYKDEPAKFLSSEALLYKNSISEGILFKHYFAQPIQGILPSNSYIVIDDKFRDEKKDIPGTIALSGSFDGDTILDIGEVTSVTEDNVRKWYVLLFSGSTLTDQTPRCRFEVPRGTLGRSLKYIGDVNGDGLGDLAYGYDEGIKIMLGFDWKTAYLGQPNVSTQFTINQNIPNPVQKDRKTTLPLSLKQNGIYSINLYTIQGIKIKQIFNGELQEGEIQFPLDLNGLSSGMYIVKMSNGTLSRERAIIIGE